MCEVWSRATLVLVRCSYCLTF